MIESILKQIDLTAKLGQDGSPLQAMNALRIIRETIAKHAAVHPTRSEGERKLSDLGNELHNLSCSLAHDNEEWAEQLSSIARELWSWPQPSPAQAEQAEAEQPEVVAWRYGFSGGIVSDKACLDEWKSGGEYQPLMTVAQHERIVGTLRAELETERMRLAGCGVAALGYFDGCADAYKSASLSDVLRLRADCDAALTEVGALRFERQQTDRAFTACINERDAALVKLAELENQEPVAWLYRGTDMGDQLTLIRLDHYWRPKYSTEEHDYIKVIPLYTAPVAQAQRSVPGEVWDSAICAVEKLCLERKALREEVAKLRTELAMAEDAASKGDAARQKCGGMEMQIQELREKFTKCMELVFGEIAYYVSPEKARDPNSRARKASVLATELRDMLAAAPGMEVPQAWLDVQAERRRQVTAEGWTPEHDDAHSHGQMARAAACYALAGSSAPNDGTAALLVSLAWPWDEQWWKPSTARRDMVKACALALAEIERLDRAAMRREDSDGGAEQ